MDRPRLMLLLCGAVFAVLLIRALVTGKISSRFSTTHRDQNPGAFWSLFAVLMLPLIAALVLATRLGLKR